MEYRLVSILRHPDGLRARCVVRTQNFGRAPSQGWRCIHALEDMPLRRARDVVDEHRRPDLDVLDEAFDALATVRHLDKDVARSLLAVLMATVPTAEPSRRLPKLQLPPRQRSHRRTASHPRGFRGVKSPPPKFAQPEVVDLRPALCDRRQASHLARAAWEFRDEVIPDLAASLGWDEARVTSRLGIEASSGDLFTALWFPGGSPAGSLDARAVEDFLWIAWRAGWPSYRFLLGAYQRLDLAADRPLAMAVMDLLSTAPPQLAEAWIRAAEEQPPELRLGFLGATLGTGAYSITPHRELFLILGQSSQIAHASDHAEQAWELMAAVARGVDPRYLETGLRLVAEHRPTRVLRQIRGGEGFEPASFQDVLVQLSSQTRRGVAIDLWLAAGRFEGLVDHLRDLDSWALEQDALESYVRFLADLSWVLPPGPMHRPWWKALRNHLGAVRDTSASIPSSHRDRAVDRLGNQIDAWETPEELESRLPPFLRFLERISRPPFLTDGHVDELLPALSDLPEAALERLYEAPIEVLRRLDRSCRRENDAKLIGWGLEALGRRLPELTFAALSSQTTRLVRVAKLLGSFRPAARDQALDGWVPGLPADGEIEHLDSAELVRWARRVAGDDAAQIPRALSEFVDGRRRLTPGQVRRHHQQLLDRRDQIVLSGLGGYLQGRLGEAVGVERPDADLLFALRLLRDVRENRRGLRRFLRSHLAGDTRYLASHPANLDWLRRHPEVDVERWTAGLVRRVELAGGRSLDLAIERDPLEILKLGSYVGSCFGLGGDFSHSVIAVLLDINKQVIFARDQHGAVVARQILAISTDKELVPFEVFPESSEEIQRVFKEFDEATAEYLGLPIARSHLTWEKPIELVLAEDWWEDGLWEVFENDEDEDDEEDEEDEEEGDGRG